MESEQHPQTPPTKDDGRRFQWLPLGRNSPQPSDDDEGGLNLGQVVGALRRRLAVIAGVTTVVTALAVLKAATNTPTYQSNFEILAKPVTIESQVISSVPQTLGNKEQEQAPVKGLDPTQLKILKSPKILAPIAKLLQPKYPDINADGLAAILVVTPQTGTEILSVGYQDKNPAKVKAVLDLVAKAYLDYSLEERLADVQQGIDFVNSQLPQLQVRVEEIQDRLQTFRQQYNLIDPESASKRLAEQTTTISQQRLDTQIKLNEARALYLDLSQQLSELPDESVASSAMQGNARYQSLLNQLLEVESQIAKESTLFREDTANIRVLQDQEQNLLPLLQREGQRVQAEVASKIRELEDRSKVLAQAEAQLNQQIKQLSVISRQYVDIQQQLKIATDNLNQFLTKREALRIDAGQRKTPWQILTPVANPSRDSADVKKSGALGVILGLLLGVGVALLLDKLSNVLHSPEEIKETSKLPILGVIPFNLELVDQDQPMPLEKMTSVADLVGWVQQFRQKFGSENGNKSAQYAASPFIEAFRSLYTNIRLLSPDSQIRSFVISSSLPGEGKSTVAVYLAQAAAALGQRVLLVDTDLRRPRLHDRLQLMNIYGLSDLISSDLDFEYVVQRSSIESNLSIITSGMVPADPTRMLSSQKMQTLMSQFKQAYDLVIYDTPPLIGLVDAKLMAAKTDGLIMVVGIDKTKASELTQALESLKVSPISLFGIIANGSKDYTTTLYDSYQHYYVQPLSEQANKPEIPTPAVDSGSQ